MRRPRREEGKRDTQRGSKRKGANRVVRDAKDPLVKKERENNGIWRGKEGDWWAMDKVQTQRHSSLKSQNGFGSREMNHMHTVGGGGRYF